MLFRSAMISVFAFLLYIGMKIRHPLPFNIAGGTLGLFLAFVTLYYLPIVTTTGKIWKLFVYPALDLLRGFAFTLGGLYQMVKSLGKKVI